ncbi:MAG TPA: S26 family signal peptidase, partial [Verrucomicrobiae bacterium]
MTFFRWFISQTVRNACAARKHYRRLLAAQSDLLSVEALGAVRLKLAELTAAIRGGHTGRINIQIEELQFAAEKWIKPYPNAAWRENVEVLLVALAVAMAIRTFFLQPFKIPTGSMQPTLFGVVGKNLINDPGFQIPSGMARLKEWFAGISYIHVVAPVDGHIEAVGPMQHFLIFNIKQTITIGG